MEGLAQLKSNLALGSVYTPISIRFLALVGFLYSETNVLYFNYFLISRIASILCTNRSFFKSWHNAFKQALLFYRVCGTNVLMVHVVWKQRWLLKPKI